MAYVFLGSGLSLDLLCAWRRAWSSSSSQMSSLLNMLCNLAASGDMFDSFFNIAAQSRAKSNVWMQAQARIQKHKARAHLLHEHLCLLAVPQAV